MKAHDLKQQEMAQAEIGSKKKGLTVKVFTNFKGVSDINGAIKILKKNVNREGVLRELRSREFFVSKGEKRRKRNAEAKRRNFKQMQNPEEFSEDRY